ncbi:MAG: RagB/SusD family nutrient uptake outer membrane protein [Gemmatimonadetes bacterium]|nr:RagB/SusD family nutrient uptake outer membrane protein [Gemmatimonadota bacterium]MYG23214.1 RagB/SusD family nutrient uptake outer membrane protein [Gemmatimonadota bacterium]MYJ37645.1 RagB/SusD family nutrient uptake outer membrane protein [Gemmatimonadota bacterium]
MKTNRTSRTRALVLGALVAAFASTGCDESIFEVKNPGRILDDDLNTSRGVGSLVTGMSADFSAGYDDLSFTTARLSDEIVGSGSYFSTGRYRRGLYDSEDSNPYWAEVQRARWVAEAGLIRMRDIEGYQFDGNAETARAYLFAGMANRWFGENFCQTVFSEPYNAESPGPGGETDTGDAMERDAAFRRAIPLLEAAVRNANSSGQSDVATAAQGGLAQVYLGLGDMQNAVANAAKVPTDFVFAAAYSSNSGRETSQIWNETHGRHEISAWMTLAGTVGAGDPRTPWTDCSDPSSGCPSGNGADGQTIHYRQEKYPTRDDDIPLVKGTEMRLIEAEAALMAGDLATAMAKVNEMRAHHGLDPLESDGTIGTITGGDGGGANMTSMSGWDILDRERHLTLWLEGRRLWDLHRWNHPHLDGGGVVYEATVARRASCMPIALDECQVNEKVSSLCFSV